MSTDDTNAASRGPGSNDLLGLLNEWAEASGTHFVARSYGMQTTDTVARDDLLQLMHAVRAAERERWRTLLRTPHRMAGGCPDEVAGEDSRDPDCPACRLMQELVSYVGANRAAEGGPVERPVMPL